MIADALDYIGLPIFALPIIGDIADAVVIGILYRVTKSKASLVINAVELIPFIGDFIPTYTISTILWILKESRRNRSRMPYRREIDATEKILKKSRAAFTRRDHQESLGTRIMRTYAILKSKTT